MLNIFLCLILAIALVVIAAVDLSSFEKLTIEFDPKCQQYFLFNGTSDYAYFYQHNGKFELWLTQNSTNYAIYTAENSSKLLFEWDGSSVIVNKQIMEPVIYEGTIHFPMKFQSEQYLCDIVGLMCGDVDSNCTIEPLTCKCETLTYKCESRTNWLLICTVSIAIGVVFFLLLYTENEHLKALLRSTLFRLIQWRRQILSGSEETISQSNEEDCVTDSTQIRRLHFTQKSYPSKEISKNLDPCT